MRQPASHLIPAPTTARVLPATCAVLALALAAPASGADTRYVGRSLTEPAKPGLTVTGTLSDLVATSSARVVVPVAWRQLSASSGKLRFRTTQNGSCHYGLTYTVRSVLGPVQDAAERAAAGLPAQSSRHLLDSGERGNRAFRVVRRSTSGGRVRVDALWVGVLTRRADIAPSGQAAWTEIRVSALSDSGDECHAGTWRESLGPAIGDSLAVARTTLRFSKR
jgi:hypothetical protein